MIKNQKKIQFTVLDNGKEMSITTQPNSHPNLMFLLKDTLGLDSFGECGGVGRCATCVIEIMGIKGISATKERNEPTTLSKMGFDQEHIRLSCQLYITKDLEGAVIQILEE